MRVEPPAGAHLSRRRRLTRDAALVAELQLRHAEPLARALAPTFYADAESIRGAIARRGSFNVIHLATPSPSC